MECIVHGFAKSQTWLSDFNFTSLHFISGSIPQADRSQKQNLVERSRLTYETVPYKNDG